MNHFRLIVILVLLVVSSLGQNFMPQAKSQDLSEMRRVMVDLSALSSMQTAMLVHYTNPPPWPSGNHLSFSSRTNATQGLPPGNWALVNMHAENYSQIIKRRHFKALEFGLLANNKCLVVDSRVPREWFLAEPLTFDLEQRLLLRTRFPDFFRKIPAADSLVGTQWVLVSREDPDGLIQRVLSGEKLKFGVTNLICETASGAERGQRLWELHEPEFAGSPSLLSVYEIQSPQAYTGAGFRLTRSEDELVLVPTMKLTRSLGGYGSERYDSQAKATYRRGNRKAQ